MVETLYRQIKCSHKKADCIMKKFEHLNFEHRKMINYQLNTHKAEAIFIINLIG